MGIYNRQCNCGAKITLNTTNKTCRVDRQIGSPICKDCQDWIKTTYLKA